MPNRYFAQTRWDPPVEFQIDNEIPITGTPITYYIRGFQKLEERYNFDNYIIHFVWGANHKIANLGDNVISVIMTDEHCRIPNYTKSIKAVFKGFGIFPNLRFRASPLRLLQIEICEFLRNLYLWLPNGWRYIFSKNVQQKIHIVPIGYGVPHDFNIIPILSRKYYVSFQGSIVELEDKRKLRRLIRSIIGTPKRYCRDRLVAVIRELSSTYGTDKIKLQTTTGFWRSMNSGDKDFARTFENTMFCCAARGTAHETFRLLDGLRAGCIVISDLLPKHSFFEGSPIIQINDWKELKGIISNLLNNPDKMNELHLASLQFWNDKLSESALADMYAKGLGLSRVT